MKNLCATITKLYFISISLPILINANEVQTSNLDRNLFEINPFRTKVFFLNV